MTDTPAVSRRRGRRGIILALLGLFVAGVLVAVAFLTADLRDIISTRHIPVPIVPAQGPITLALTGDTSLLLAPHPGDSFSKVANLVREATLGFTNLEISVSDEAATRGRHAQGHGRIAGGDGAAMVRALGFDLVSLANNHTMDFGDEGLQLTEKSLDLAGVLHAGAGVDLAAARAPVIAGEGARQVALIAVTASASAASIAGASQPGSSGRAGVNPLRYTADITVDAAAFRTLADAVKPPDAGPPPGADELTVSGTRIHRGDRTSVRFVVNDQDRTQILEGIRRARESASIVIVSLHSHEPSNASDQPADFIRQFARDAVDAGAAIVVGHGPHRVRGFEQYKNGLILYSLGHFTYDTAGVDLVTSDPFDAGRNLYGPVAGAVLATPSPESQLQSEAWWEGLLVSATFTQGMLREAAIYPLDLSGQGEGGKRGVPALAQGERGSAILRHFSEISGPEGEKLILDPGGAILRVPISEKR